MAEKKKPARGMLQLKNELDAGTIRNLYLLYGPERYLLKEYKAKLLKLLVPEGDTLNYTAYSGDKINVPSLVDTIRTMPFLGERRVVLAEGTGFFQQASDELLEGIKSMAETTVLIFLEPDIEKSTGISSAVDKRGRLYKFFDQAGAAFFFGTPDPDQLNAWVTMQLGKAGIPMEKKVPARLIAAVGNDLQNLNNEIEKLISYTMGQDAIRLKDVEDICVSQVEDKVFDMIDALSSRKKDKALTLYSDLLYLREPAMRILALIRRQYMILLKVKNMQQDNTPQESYAKLAGIMPFLVKKTIAQASAYSYHQLVSACDACYEATLSVQKGAFSEQNALERLMMKLLSIEPENQ